MTDTQATIASIVGAVALIVFDVIAWRWVIHAL
jgi:hypothetical protein